MSEIHVLMFNEWYENISSEKTVAGLFLDWDEAVKMFEGLIDETFERQEIPREGLRPILEARKNTGIDCDGKSVFSSTSVDDSGIIYHLETHPANQLTPYFKMMIDEKTGEVSFSIADRIIMSEALCKPEVSTGGEDE